MENKYEPVRQAALTLGASIVIAAAFIGWSLPDSTKPQKFEAFVVDDKIVRLNTSDGNIVACDFSRCVRVLGNGKNLQPNSAPALVGRSDPAPSRAGQSKPAAGESQPSLR